MHAQRDQQSLAPLGLVRLAERDASLEQAVKTRWNGTLSDVLVKSIAVVALLLALVGLYAVTSHTVAWWSRELGLRVALGARGHAIAWLVLLRS